VFGLVFKFVTILVFVVELGVFNGFQKIETSDRTEFLVYRNEILLLANDLGVKTEVFRVFVHIET
jgi:hypothetical protein